MNTSEEKGQILMVILTLALCMLLFGGIALLIDEVNNEAFRSGEIKKNAYASCESTRKECFTKLVAKEFVCWYNDYHEEECIHVENYYESKDLVIKAEEE